MTVSALLGTCLVALEHNDSERPSKEVISAINDLLAALNMPADSDLASTMRAIENALSAVIAPAPSPDTTAESADAPPPQLSAVERAALAKIKDPARRAAYLAARSLRSTESQRRARARSRK